MINIQDIRKDFPILNRQVNKQNLIYFDNGASTQKPASVIRAITDLYTGYYANIHRGVHTLSRECTEAFEAARKTIASFIGAHEQELIFTSGTTDAINLVASGINLSKDDEILISHLEHHSNILPWQLQCEKKQAVLKVIPIEGNGKLQTDLIQSLLSEKTKIVAITQVSNTLGVINPVEEIIKNIRKFNPNILILIDGAQSVPHLKIDVKDMDCDFFVFSGHKIYGPTGIGALYAKKERMEQLQLSRSGGGTIREVSFDKTVYVEGALRFEPGTPNIEGAIGLAEAIKYVEQIGMEQIAEHEHQLLIYAQDQLRNFPEIQIYADHSDKAAVISFNLKGQHPFDVGTLLDKYGIAVRTGHHCTQPLMSFLNIPGTVRASFALYNTKEEVDMFISSMKKVIKLLS